MIIHTWIILAVWMLSSFVCLLYPILYPLHHAVEYLWEIIRILQLFGFKTTNLLSLKLNRKVNEDFVVDVMT